MKVKWLNTLERAGSLAHATTLPKLVVTHCQLHCSVMGRCGVAPGHVSGPDVGTDNMADTSLARCSKD